MVLEIPLLLWKPNVHHGVQKQGVTRSPPERYESISIYVKTDATLEHCTFIYLLSYMFRSLYSNIIR